MNYNSNSGTLIPQIDPGITPQDAYELGLIGEDLLIQQGVGGTDEGDAYSFSVNTAGEYSFSLDSLTADADLFIYDGQGNLIDSSMLANDSSESLTLDLAQGDYYIYVESYDGVATDYSLLIDAPGTSTPNPPSQDAGDTIDTALEVGSLDAGFVATESIGGTDSLDYYQFSLGQSGIFTADLFDMSADADVRLVDDANGNGTVDQGEVMAWQWEIGSNSESIRSFLDAGDYILEVGSFGNETTNYSLETNFTAATRDTQEFNIDVVGGEGSQHLSQEMVNGILAAAEFWENAISHSTFNDGHTLTIEVGGTVQEWGANGGVLASAAPINGATDSNGNLMPTEGISNVNINPDAIEALSADAEFFTRVMIHEFGHVMGIGTLWEHNELIDFSTATYSADTYAGIVYGALLGNGEATAIPLTTGEGQGSDLSHWAEEVFGNELMTHQAEAPGTSMPFSHMTIASLRDMGWNVNYGTAEVYPDGLTAETANLGSTEETSGCGCGMCASCGSNALSQSLLDVVAIDDSALI